MRIRVALSAFFCLAACCALVAQDASRNGLLTSPASSSSGRSAARSSGTARKGIFDIATSPDSGKNNGSAATSTATGRTTTATASPFGTTSTRTRSASARRWKTNCKIADCIRAKTIPSNTNLTISGTITDIVTDGRYVILTMFDSVETVTESGAKGDVPVTYTVVLDAESVAGNNTIRENTKKSFTLDSNYAYLVWNDSGCTVRAVDNALTEPDQITKSGNSTRR